MASQGSTDGFRADLAAMYFERMTTGPLTVEFGDGGHEEDGTPKPFDPAQTELNNSLLSKAPEVFSMPDDWSIQITGKLEDSELVGEEVSEFGIFLDGSLVALRNNSKKVKDSDEEYPITITIYF